MATLIQEILRTLFYVISLYTAYLLIPLINKKKIKYKNCLIYIILSAILLITLGNIIIFNITMYDAMLGSMEIHTIIYTLILMGGISLVYFLKQTIKEMCK